MDFSRGSSSEDKNNTPRGSYFHRNQSCTSQYRSFESSRMNKTTWAASCTYLNHVSPQSTSKDCACGHLSKNWFVIHDMQEGSEGQLFSYRRRTEAEPESPLIFGVTGLCLNVTGHIVCTQADSLHPAHVIISSDSFWICAFVFLLKAHWFKGTSHYPLLGKEWFFFPSGLTCTFK